MESLFEYETRAGIWRLLRLFAERRVKVTFFATARTLEINPEATAEIVRQGHEVCSHGFRWVEHFTLSRGEEQEQIRAAVASIRKTTGRRPLGWYCREPSENTVELLAEEGGFLYDSDVYDDDYPYYVDVRGKKFLIVPYTPDINDFHYLASRFSGSEDFFHYMKDSFDQLYGEALENPKMMNVGVHVRISGRPGRTVALDRFLQYVEGFPDVWVAWRVDIARWWLRHIKP